MKIYLAGPIAGLTFDGAEDWREYARAKLAPLDAYSPLRGKHYLRNTNGPLSGHGREYFDLGLLSKPRSVMTRDRFDATRADIVLANLRGSDRVSIGTCMEIAWADLRRIPVVGVLDDAGGPHDHMFITEAVGFPTKSLDEAIHVIRCIAGV